MISIAEVEFHENPGFLQWGKSGIEEWKRVLVVNRDVVEPAIVDTWAEGAVFLLHEEKSSPHGRRRRCDQSGGQGLTNVILHGLAFWSGKMVEAAGWEWGLWKQVDRAVVWTMWGERESSLFGKHLLQVVVGLWNPRQVHCRGRRGEVWRSGWKG